MAPTKFPLRPRAHQLDDEAVAAFSAAVAPHVVDERGKHDYGNDLRVTVVDATGATHRVYGRAYSVQVKGSDGPPKDTIRIRVASLNLWADSFEPVVVAVVSHPGKPDQEIRLAWIDDELLVGLDTKSPGWRCQDTVALTLAETKRTTFREDIEHVVERRRLAAKSAWSPAEFQQLQTDSLNLATRLKIIANRASLGSAAQQIRDVSEQLRTMNYVVALLGNSRSGKSTLINGLVRRSVSPVNRLPTTAVPMLFVADEVDSAVVHFVSGKTTAGPATSEFLAPFVSQDENRNNHRQVAHVEVHLGDELLASGISLLDAPGFGDPDPEIRAVANAALDRANACLYLIDVAPFSSSSFFLSDAQVSDIKKLTTLCDRVILLLSKADILSDADRKRVRDYIVETLEKHGDSVSLKLSGPPVFSGLETKGRKPAAKGAQVICLGPDEIRDLIWSELLQNGALATMRVRQRFRSAFDAHRALTRDLAARRVGGDEARAILAKLNKVRPTVQELHSYSATECKKLVEASVARVAASASQALGEAEARLKVLPLDSDLPNSKNLRADLIAYANSLLKEECSVLGNGLVPIQRHVEEVIEHVLEQLRIGSVKAAGTKEPAIPELGTFPITGFDATVVRGLAVAFVALLTGNVLSAAMTFGAYLLSQFIGREKARAQEIELRMIALTNAMNKAQSQINAQLAQSVAGVRDHIIGKVIERGDAALLDLQKQLQRAGQPITKEESASLASLADELDGVGDQLEEVYARLVRVTGTPARRAAP